MSEPGKFDDTKYQVAEPRADAMIESLRAVGYSLPAAIADLIDNSISAEAHNIWIECMWRGHDSYVLIEDDGVGMSEPELVRAMTLGSVSPLEVRKPADLGRFGMGLKTASFSQCCCLTVRSKRAGSEETTREWDLDYVKEAQGWYLRKSTDETGEATLRKRLPSLHTGTSVLWRSLDRVIVPNTATGDQKAQARFLGQMAEVENHISMTFHRYISQRGRLKIFINSRQILAWDPFLTDHDFTQEYPEERIVTIDGAATVRGYVLPHHSKLSDDDKDTAAGPRGWVGQQGLYIYRNERLLVSGGWPGLGLRSEVQFMLARVAVDITNATDTEWGLDIKKSRARPPALVRDRLKQIAEIIRERSRQTLRSKGRVFTKTISHEFAPVWREQRRGAKIGFEINRDHPIISAAVKVGSNDIVESALQLLEETLPFEQIWFYLSENPQSRREPFESESGSLQIDQITKLLSQVIAETSIPPAQLESKLLQIEPFNKFPDLVSSIVRRGNANG